METVKGVWVFNDTVTIPTTSTNYEVSFNATPENKAYTRIVLSSYSHLAYGYMASASSSTVYTEVAYKINGGWVSEDYKIIDFGTTEQTVSDDCYTWLTANATQQASEEPEESLPYKFTKLFVGDAGIEELNIFYGNTQPEDTNKLWVKANKPSKVIIKTNVGYELECSTIGELNNVLSDAGYATVGDNIYIFGGNKISEKQSAILKFNMVTETLSTLSVTMGAPFAVMCAAAVGTNIYLFGGRDQNNSYIKTIKKFDTTTNTLTTLSATLPTAADGMSCVAYGTDIYVFGGNTANGPINTIRKFDTLTNTLTTLDATLNAAVFGSCVCLLDDYIYVFGGYKESSEVQVLTQRFNPADDSIENMRCTLRVANARCVEVNKYVAVLNGLYVYLYDPRKDGVIQLGELTNIATLSQVGVLKNKIYILGGYKISDIARVTVGFPLATDNICIENTFSGNEINIIDTTSKQVQAFVKNVYVGNSEGYAERADAYLHDGTDWVEI